MVRSPIITVSRGRFSPNAAQVLEQVRGAGRASRDELTELCGLSSATVGRTITQLIEVGLLRDRPDQVRAGAVGRPGVPVEIDPDHYVTIGVHIGRRIATVALGDLTGRVLVSQEVRRAAGADPDLDRLSRVAATLLGTFPGRVPLAAGLVSPWRELGLVPSALEAELHEFTGLPVRTGDHVSAVAAAEFMHRRHGTGGLTLYIYARDTLGFSVAVDRGVQTDVTRAAGLSHFPTGSGIPCSCGRTGCLEVTAADQSVAQRAVGLGLVERARIEDLYARAEDPAVRSLLTERARVLGEVAGSLRDMLAPDRVVLVGQAFTGCPAVLDEITAACDAHTALDRVVPVSFTRFGSDIQAISACTVALGPVLDDPLAAVAADQACRRRCGA